MIRRILAVVLISVGVGVGLLALSPRGGEALPGDSYLYFPGPGDGYVEVADAAGLEPQDALTWETWVYLSTYESWNGGSSCPSLIGKQYGTSHWVGICSGRIRFYPGESDSQDSTGMVPLMTWTHVAVTYDEVTVKFYINGALDSEFAMTAVLGDNTYELRFGSDASWEYPPKGGLDEIRLWNVVRTQVEIAGAMNTTITAPETGLVGVWNFDDDAEADVGGFGGTLVESAEIRTGAVPTPGPTMTPSPEPSETPTPGPGLQVQWADANCDDEVNPIDSLLVLRYDAGLSVDQELDCPEMGGTVGVAGGGPIERNWSDANCDGEVDPVDSLAILRYDGGLDVNQEPGCPEIGEYVQVTVPV